MEKVKLSAGVHLCTMLFGLSAVFAKQLTVSASSIVAGRAFFAALTLLLILVCTRSCSLNSLTRKDWFHYIMNGVLLALHWVCFFTGVERGGVAVGTLGFACFPAFVSVFGWCIFRSYVGWRDVLAMFLIAAGLIVISPDIVGGGSDRNALLWALAAGVSYAIIVLYNNHAKTSGTPLQSSFIQCMFCAIVVTPIGAGGVMQADFSTLLHIIFIGVVCTGVAYSMLTYALHHVDAGKAAVIISLEPVWAITFSIVWLGTAPDTCTLLGGSVIVVAVIVSALPRRGRTT
ncbi:DMT family transporter [Raoultella ornithinolytica]|uniref:DMT family transporter n=1 Tax=Raoultella ornithinolytica TaxID=54291 RepID=UPI003DA816C1